MTTITFDTLKYVERLTAAGVPEAHAKAEAQALTEVLNTNNQDLVTNDRLEKELAPIRTDLVVLKWMIGIQLGGIIALILKAFFPH